jgi:hypothetical protein
MNGSGLNTDEVKKALADLKANGGNEEDVRYLERVLESRGVRKADVSSHEIVLGNPDAYPETTVKEQEDLAIGRPNEPVAAKDLGVRGAAALEGDNVVEFDDTSAAKKTAAAKK